MNLLALEGLKGSELVQELMYEVNGRDYSPAGRVWDNSNIHLKNILWNLANLNKLEHNTKFKREWLKMPNDIKRDLRIAIQDLRKFVKQCDVVMGCDL